MEAQKTQTNQLREQSLPYLGKQQTFLTTKGQKLKMRQTGKLQRSWLRADGRLQQVTFLTYSVRVESKILTKTDTLIQLAKEVNYES